MVPSSRQKEGCQNTFAIQKRGSVTVFVLRCTPIMAPRRRNSSAASDRNGMDRVSCGHPLLRWGAVRVRLVGMTTTASPAVLRLAQETVPRVFVPTTSVRASWSCESDFQCAGFRAGLHVAEKAVTTTPIQQDNTRLDDESAGLPRSVLALRRVCGRPQHQRATQFPTHHPLAEPRLSVRVASAQHQATPAKLCFKHYRSVFLVHVVVVLSSAATVPYIAIIISVLGHNLFTRALAGPPDNQLECEAPAGA